MNTQQNVSIELKKGTRLIRETRGNREIMWIEDDNFLTRPLGKALVNIILFIGLIWGISIYFSPDDSEKQPKSKQSSTAVVKTRN